MGVCIENMFTSAHNVRLRSAQHGLSKLNFFYFFLILSLCCVFTLNMQRSVALKRWCDSYPTAFTKE